MTTFAHVSGLKIYCSPHLTVAGDPVQAQRVRSWKKRLFSWPWFPWRKMETYTFVPQVPSPIAYLSNGCCYIHPETWNKLLENHKVSVSIGVKHETELEPHTADITSDRTGPAN